MDYIRALFGLGSIAAGIYQIKSSLVENNQQVSGILNSFNKQLAKDIAKSKIHSVGNINQRANYVVKQIQKGREDPQVREFAMKSLTKKCGKNWCIPERDYEGEIKAIFNSIRKNVRYTGDIYKLDTFQGAKRTLAYKGGDCDCYTITLGSCLQTVGYPVKIRIIQTVDSPDYNHIFLLAGTPPRNPTRWISLDASVNKPAGWHPPKSYIKRYKDFEVN